MKQNKEDRNTGQGRLLLGDYVLVTKRKETNGAPYTIPYLTIDAHEINESRITTRRATDERTICRDISHFKLD